MHRILFLIYVSLFSFVLQAQTRRALVIGLGEQMDSCWSKINGDRDIPLVRDMLYEAGFRDIRTLVNRQATKAGIVSAFGKLAQDCKAGDIVYVHFSGHGQQMTDREGDEEDGWDESWIPYDAYRKPCDKDRGEKHLTDDEVGRMLDVVKERVGASGKILVAVDACHSGSSTRNFDETDAAVRGVWDNFVMTDTNSSPRNEWIEMEQSWITISACKDYQSNFEMTDKKVGKLTFALYRIMKDRLGLSNEELEKQLIRFMLENPNPKHCRQTPVVSGVKDVWRISDVLQK